MSIVGNFFQNRKVIKAQNLTNEAIFFYQQGDLNRAKIKCRKAIDSLSNHAPAWNMLGTIFMIDKNFEEASECFKNALRHNKLLVTAYPTLALCYKELGRQELAIETLKMGTNLFNSKEYADELKLMIGFEGLGMFENMISGNQSISEFQKTIKKMFDDTLKEISG